MPPRLAALQRHLPPPSRWMTWCALGVLVHALLALAYLMMGSALAGVDWAQPYFIYGDTYSYLRPVDDWLAGLPYGGHGLREGRLPGYALAYAPLRAVLPPQAARAGLVVLQTVASGMATAGTAWLAWRLSGGRHFGVFLLAFAAKALYLQLVRYQFYLVTEAFFSAALVGSLLGLVRWADSGHKRPLLLAGMALAWAIWLKLSALPLAMVWGGVVVGVAAWSHGRWRPALVAAALFLLVPVLMQGGWVLRNAARYGKVFVGQSTIYYNYGVHNYHGTPEIFYYAGGGEPSYVVQLLKAWGEDAFYYEPRARTFRWLTGYTRYDARGTRASIPNPPPLQLQPWHTAGPYGYDSLLRLRSLCLQAVDTAGISLDSTMRAYHKADDLARRWLHAYTRAHPWQHQVASRARLLWTMLLRRSGSEIAFQQPFGELPPWAKALKLLTSSLYFGCMVLGVVAALVALRWPSPTRLLWVMGLGTIVLIYPVVLRSPEYRYMDPLFPFWVMGVGLLWGAWQGRKAAPRAH